MHIIMLHMKYTHAINYPYIYLRKVFRTDKGDPIGANCVSLIWRVGDFWRQPLIVFGGLSIQSYIAALIDNIHGVRP